MSAPSRPSNLSLAPSPPGFLLLCNISSISLLTPPHSFNLLSAPLIFYLLCSIPSHPSLLPSHLCPFPICSSLSSLPYPIISSWSTLSFLPSYCCLVFPFLFAQLHCILYYHSSVSTLFLLPPPLRLISPILLPSGKFLLTFPFLSAPTYPSFHLLSALPLSFLLSPLYPTLCIFPYPLCLIPFFVSPPCCPILFVLPSPLSPILSFYSSALHPIVSFLVLSVPFCLSFTFLSSPVHPVLPHFSLSAPAHPFLSIPLCSILSSLPSPFFLLSPLPHSILLHSSFPLLSASS